MTDATLLQRTFLLVCAVGVLLYAWYEVNFWDGRK